MPTDNYHDTSDRLYIWDPTPADDMVCALQELFPEVMQIYACPRCIPLSGGLPPMVRHLVNLIPHLVDSHDMPRDDIADWLDTNPEQVELPSPHLSRGAFGISGPGIFVQEYAEQTYFYAESNDALLQAHQEFVSSISVDPPFSGFDFYVPTEIEANYQTGLEAIAKHWTEAIKLDVKKVKFSFKDML